MITMNDKKLRCIKIREETHSILKMESVKRKRSMIDLVHDAVVDYFNRYSLYDKKLDPEMMKKIKLCIDEIFNPVYSKMRKSIWIEDLIKRVSKKIDVEKYLIEITINRLISCGILIKDYIGILEKVYFK